MKKLFTAFVEHKEFQKSCPWSVIRQSFTTNTISPPHYAETVELLICNGVTGTAYIGGHKYDMSGQKVLYVAPQTVHSFEHFPSDGYLLNLKFHPSMLSNFLDVKNILAEEGLSLAELAVEYDNFQPFFTCAEALAKASSTTEALLCVLSVLRLLEQNTPAPTVCRVSAVSDTVIKQVIAWTEQNFGRKISLDEVANIFGYTKNYFCDVFKTRTGTTYLKYLNNVRITNACAMLRRGTPVGQTAQLCGFETDSYFIHLFKKTVGVTPKVYQSHKA